MEGVRIPWKAKRPWHLEPGEYSYNVADDGAFNVWVRLPNGLGPLNLSTWEYTVHEDGTLTLTPSIMAYGHKSLTPAGEVVEYSDWHGYLRQGRWEE